MEPVVIVIDGEIGAGKTTLLQALAEKLIASGHRVAVVPEPVEEWEKVGIFQEFYKDPERWAYDFQTYTFVTRVEKSIEVYEQNKDADVFLLERSIFTDRYIFMELQREMCGDMLMQMYKRWWRLWTKVMPFKPTTFVYLKPSIDACMSRVHIRSRDGEIIDGESGVTRDYQIKMRKSHKDFFKSPKMDKYHKIKVPKSLANADFSIYGEARDAIANFIAERLIT